GIAAKRARAARTRCRATRFTTLQSVDSTETLVELRAAASFTHGWRSLGFGMKVKRAAHPQSTTSRLKRLSVATRAELSQSPSRWFFFYAESSRKCFAIAPFRRNEITHRIGQLHMDFG